MKIAFTGGGTLGHIYPSLALYDYIIDRDKSFEFIWIGRNNKNEMQIIESQNIQFFAITCGKLRRYFSLKNIFDVFKVIVGFFQALKILKQTKPDLIFSKGGYVSVPVVYAAHKLKIKIITHESDITLGLASRLNSRVATTIFKGFALNEDERADKRFIYSANPLKTDLQFFKNIDLENYEKKLANSEVAQYSGKVKTVRDNIQEKFDKSKKIILIVGGSLGAMQINDLIAVNLDELVKDYNIYHQMGERTFISRNIRGYIGVKQIGHELGYLYKIADLVVSRCGANTLNEEILFNKNILAIPLDNSKSRGEQVLNAQYYKDLKLLEVYEKNMNFIDTITNLLNNETIEKRKLEFQKLSYIDTNDIIYKNINEILN
jgi:UDP-N-acetylglucosamine--N-acetylmuramyl-(pentapeptide) pyrophosphoryl-undecaprenol N-acetylglucosamine transferase